MNYIKDRKLKVIHLHREDRTKQIISAYTNQFMHKHDGKKKMILGENQIRLINEKIENNKKRRKRTSFRRYSKTTSNPLKKTITHNTKSGTVILDYPICNISFIMIVFLNS